MHAKAAFQIRLSKKVQPRTFDLTLRILHNFNTRPEEIRWLLHRQGRLNLILSHTRTCHDDHSRTLFLLRQGTCWGRVFEKRIELEADIGWPGCWWSVGELCEAVGGRHEGRVGAASIFVWESPVEGVGWSGANSAYNDTEPEGVSIYSRLGIMCRNLSAAFVSMWRWEFEAEGGEARPCWRPGFTQPLLTPWWCREAMDQLGCNRYCCRRMVMTHVDLIEKLLKLVPLVSHTQFLCRTAFLCWTLCFFILLWYGAGN